jgi:hypothetical protein
MSAISHTVTPQTKIDACCDAASSRYALGAVHILPSAHKGEVYCAATDGRVATVALASGTAEGEALLPMKLSKPGKPAHLNGRWECNGKVANTVEGRFPRMGDVLPEVPPCELSSYSVLRIKGEQLKRIADAIGEESYITLFVPPNGEKGHVDKPIAMRGTHGIAVAMPIVAEAQHDAATYETIRKAYQKACADNVAASR